MKVFTLLKRVAYFVFVLQVISRPVIIWLWKNIPEVMGDMCNEVMLLWNSFGNFMNPFFTWLGSYTEYLWFKIPNIVYLISGADVYKFIVYVLVGIIVIYLIDIVLFLIKGIVNWIFDGIKRLLRLKK